MKLGVCVPYRNRESHLKEFSPAVHTFLRNRNIEHKIYFAHQCDDLLFNRGKMKNIAADIAFKDGCDYIVWHDIDMIPEDDSCDYSYNSDFPQHLAVRISQTDYKLKYEEYFGGAILFTKEQVEKTNGYSNDYWGWGMEDDDLFWRCYVNNLVNKNTIIPNKTFNIGIFNGIDSFIEIPPTRILKNFCNRSHTLSILVKANQKNEVPVHLIGDENAKYWEYPIFRKPGYDYGISYNNSRAYTTMVWNYENQFNYMWMKRYENIWSWVTFKVDADNKRMHLYINGIESNASLGTGVVSPMNYEGILKSYPASPYYIGTSPSVNYGEFHKFFKGEIADVRMYNRCLSQKEINNIPFECNTENLLLHYDFQYDEEFIIDKSEYQNNGIMNNIFIKKDEKIELYNSAVPFRRDGKFRCLPHKTEGIVDGKWSSPTTFRNEKKYVLEMQQGKIDWKNDGMSNLTYSLLDIEDIGNESKLINCKC